jgi:hypothetical protein
MSHPASRGLRVSDPVMPPAIGWDLATAPRAEPRDRSQGRPFGADIDLLAPARSAAGTLRTGPCVASEMRRKRHLNRQLITLWQREKAPGCDDDAVDKHFVDAVTDQIEEPNIPCCIAQFPQERGTFGCRALKLAEIKDRQSTHGEAGSRSCNRNNISACTCVTILYGIYR